ASKTRISSTALWSGEPHFQTRSAQRVTNLLRGLCVPGEIAQEYGFGLFFDSCSKWFNVAVMTVPISAGPY
ncbi:MAG TPA: hypothetical protein VKN35_02920, partial [Xanthomonadales bacterium]|nr:hypothetical protein [Xanthomonadales bacterium]